MKLAVILLAAGSSRRFGANKLLYEFRGRKMIDYTLERYRHLGCSRVIVSCYPQILTAARDYQPVYNARSDLGIAYSLRLGLEASPEADAYLFSVCDQPNMKEATARQFISGFAASGRGIGCCAHKAKPGNPVIFSRAYKEELLQLSGDSGGKRLLKRHPGDVWYFEVEDPSELADVDTREDTE